MKKKHVDNQLAKIGNAEQLCMAQRVQVTDGRGNGARQIYVANGKLNFVLSESNALDILRLWHEGTNIGFVSKNGLYTAPSDFLGNFPAGMLYTCGLDAIGGVEGHAIHGRIHSIPAEIRELSADAAGVLWGLNELMGTGFTNEQLRETGVKLGADVTVFDISAEIRDTALFGQNLVLTRTVSTAAGSDEVKIEDVLENHAFRDEKYCMLYHVNVGYPIVDAGAKISGKFVESKPRTPWAEHEMSKMLEVESPLDNAEETCYFHNTKDGKMTITNAKLGKRFTVASSLRKFVQWKSRASGDYVVGLEPCTSWLDGELKYSVLRPGKSVKHTIVLKVEEV